MTGADIAIIISALAVCATLYQVYLAWRARRQEKMRAELSGDRVVVQSALELLKPYKEQVAELRAELTNANTALASASVQISDLTSRLFEAQTELTALRQQIKTMSSDLRDDRDGKV
jgi:chromosome segregation ATPase